MPKSCMHTACTCSLSLSLSLSLCLQGRKHARLEKKMCKKYHMVKFLDRTHISRRLKQVDRKLANDPPPPSKVLVPACTCACVLLSLWHRH